MIINCFISCKNYEASFLPKSFKSRSVMFSSLLCTTFSTIAVNASLNSWLSTSRNLQNGFRSYVMIFKGSLTVLGSFAALSLLFEAAEDSLVIWTAFYSASMPIWKSCRRASKPPTSAKYCT